VTAFADEMEIEFADSRHETVGVIVEEDVVAVTRLDAVVRHSIAFECTDPHSPVFVRQRQTEISADDDDTDSERLDDSEHHMTVVGMRAEDAVRIVVTTFDDAFEFVIRHRIDR